MNFFNKVEVKLFFLTQFILYKIMFTCRIVTLFPFLKHPTED